MRTVRHGLAIGTLLATLAMTAMAPAASAATSHGGRAGGVPTFWSYQFLQNAHYVNFGNCVGTWQPTSPPNPELVTIRNTFKNWFGTHRATYLWHMPGGKLYATHVHTFTANGRIQFCDSIRLTGPFPGIWTVRIVVDGVIVRNVQWNIPPM